MSVAVILTCILFQDFQAVSKTILNIPPTNLEPAVVIDQDGSIFYRDYGEAIVYKLNSSGEKLFQFGKPGRGPGEIEKPFRLTLLDNERKLLIMSMHGKASLFDSRNGKFIKSFHINSSNQIKQWGQNSIISMGGPPDGSNFHVYDVSTAKISESWFPVPKLDLNKPFTRSYALAVDGASRRIYFSEGTYPEIWIIDYKSETRQNWDLKLPKHYNKPPDKAMSNAIRFDRVKVQEYYEAFTQVYNLLIVDKKYLAVGWSLYKPYPSSVDLYSLGDKEILIKDFKIPGKLIATSGNKIFVLEEKDDGDNFQHILHAYKLLL